MSEIDDFREHWDRYRAVTLQHFEILSDEEMAWRPRPDAFSCAQQLLHIVQCEDFYIRGLFLDDWNLDRLKFPKPMPSTAALRQQFDEVRRDTTARLSQTADDALDQLKKHGFADYEVSLRSWLWFVLEHEIHHKAQLGEYLRALGHLPPYFAEAMPLGDRPDIQARIDFGGV